MGLGYALAYRLGLTPWERAATEGAAQGAALFDREEADRAQPYGRALDLGCGTGRHTMDLAARGWQATGVELVSRASHQAQQRAAAEGSTATFVQGDVTALDPAAIGRDYSFFFDLGCFHGLTDAQRAAMAAGVTAAAAPKATMLLFAFQPGRRGPLPRGASRTDIEQAFTGWTVIDEAHADSSGMPGPLKKAAPLWYRLRRRS